MRQGKAEVPEDIFDYSTDENDSLESEPLACDRCCYKTQKKWLMDRHVENHKKDKPFKCPYCRFTNRDASAFVDHFTTHLPKTKIIKCCFCSFKSMPSMMKVHVLRHGPTERLDCSECEYWTLHLRSMTEHVEAYHTKKYPCSMCSKVMTKYSLSKHMKKAHKSTKPLNIKTAAASRPGLSITAVGKSSNTLARKTSFSEPTMIPSMMPVVQLERCWVPPGCWKSLECSRRPQTMGNVVRSDWEKSDVDSGSNLITSGKGCGTPKVALGSKTHRKPLEAVTANCEPMDWPNPTALGKPKPSHVMGTRNTRKNVEMEHNSEAALSENQTEAFIACVVPKANQIRKPNYFPNLIAEYGDTLMQCSICDFQTRREHLLKQHEAKHANDLPFVCRKCDFQNISVYEFANHMIVAHSSVKDSVYACCFCDFWTHKKHNIPIHLNHHRGAARLFDCPECEEVLNSKTGLQIHFEKLHCEYFDCEFCGKNMTKYELISHAREHADETIQPELSEAPKKDFVDPIPGSSTGSENAKYKPKPLSKKKLDMDKSGIDGDARKIDDDSKGSTAHKPKLLPKQQVQLEGGKTQRESSSFSGLNTSDKTKTEKIQARQQSEMLDKRPSEAREGLGKKSRTLTSAASPVKELECRLCDYKTEISSLMDRHKEKHKADTPFKCTKCKYETLSSMKMGWHFMYHFPSDKEFPCPYCNFNSKSRKSIHGHIERHRAVKFFDCSKCQFTGNSSSVVQTHFKRMHVDTYSCTICGKVMTKHAMMKHLKKRHPTACIMPETGGPAQTQKHYMNFMKLVDSGTKKPQVKRKRPGKPQADNNISEVSPGGVQPSDHSVSDLKAAQAALAREIFGEMSDSDDGAQKRPKPSLTDLPSAAVSSNTDSSIVPASSSSIPKPVIKSESEDSDSDAETVPKLSCPKCDFTTNQIADIKIHYREMHEIEYACKLCPEVKPSTKYELLIHFKNGHPKVSFQHYNSMTKCCLNETEILPTTRPVVLNESCDSDSDDETILTTKLSKSVDIDPARVSDTDTQPVASISVSSDNDSKIESELKFKKTKTDTAAKLCSSPPTVASPAQSSIEDVDPSPAYSPIRKDSSKINKDSHGVAIEVEQQEEQTAEIICKNTEPVNAAKTTVETIETPSRSPQKLKCDECEFNTNKTSLMQRHRIKHKSGAPLVCPQCHFQNNSPYEFLLHWTKHFPDHTALRCCFCAFATITKLDLALHFCVHNNTRVFDCPECDYSTSTKAFFEGHVWSIHKKVTCQKCQESMYKEKLSNHKCFLVKDDDDDDVFSTSPRVHSVSIDTAGRIESPELNVARVSSDVSRGTASMAAESDDMKDIDKRIVSQSDSSMKTPTAEITLASRVNPAIIDGGDNTVNGKLLDKHESVSYEQSGDGSASHDQNVSIVDEKHSYERRIVVRDMIGVGDSDVVDQSRDDSDSESRPVDGDQFCSAEKSLSGKESVQLLAEGNMQPEICSRQPTGPYSDEGPPQQLSFPDDSKQPSDNVPVIDISGTNKPAPSEPFAGPSWTEPIETDDDVDDGDNEEATDHNYVISQRRSSKSPSAERSLQFVQQRSSPIRSDDFLGDYVTEVVFDNGMSAIVLEVSDDSEEDV